MSEMDRTDTSTAIHDSFMSRNVKDSNLEKANLVDTTDRIASMIDSLASAITPQDTLGGQDATGGTVLSLTEAVMGVSAGLVQIADAIASLKD
jgi:hypothetical protein